MGIITRYSSRRSEKVHILMTTNCTLMMSSAVPDIDLIVTLNLKTSSFDPKCESEHHA